MELIANGVNRNFLESILPPVKSEIDGVLAAIAYGNDDNEKLITNSIGLGCRLDIWMRYDHTVPVQPSLLEKILRNSSKNIFCKLIPDVLHSKVIWWKGYGAYIGSANLTGRAWTTNIEAGIFINDSELISNKMDIQLEEYFDVLMNDCKSYALSKDIIDEMKALQKQRKGINNIDKESRNKRKLNVWDGLSNYDKKKSVDKKRENFQKEWLDTLQILSDIANLVENYRPKWLKETVPASWQADQFLHAFYFNQVNEGGNRYPFEEYYFKNEKDPSTAAKQAMVWWKNLPKPPSEEDINLYERAPYIREHLRKEKILTLTVKELEKICANTHATRDHVSKIPMLILGRPDLSTMPLDGRLQLYSEWLIKQKNRNGQNILELLNFVLYEGHNSEIGDRLYIAAIGDRLYIAARNEDYHIDRYGLNSIAEVIGWALPEVVPPRNGRTSKALRALGYPVTIY